MASVRDIFVRLGIKSDPRGFKRAEAGISKLKTSAVALAGVFTTGALAIGFRKLINAASDAAETENKFGAVFGSASDKVQKAIDDIGARTGATELQLQRMSSEIGALIKPALGGSEAAGKMAAQVSELALDIASFNNVTSDDALIALRSGLMGSAEPLQRFGVDVRQVAIAEEARRQGINKSIKDMTKAQVTTLRFAAIMRQLGEQGALGDAEKTANAFANASRNLGEALFEIAAKLGSLLLPKVEKLVNMTRQLVDRFEEWFKANKAILQQRLDVAFTRIGRVLTGLTRVGKRVIQFFGSIVDFINDLSTGMRQIAMIGLALATAFLIPAGPLLLLIALVAIVIEDLEVMEEGGDSVSGALVEGFKKATDGVSGFDTALNAAKATLMAVGDIMAVAFGGTSLDDIAKATEGMKALDTVANALKATLTGLFTILTLGLAELKVTAEGISVASGPLFRAFGVDLQERMREARARGATSAAGIRATLNPALAGPDMVPSMLARPAAAGGPQSIDNSINMRMEINPTPNMTVDDLMTRIPQVVRTTLEEERRQANQSFVVEAP